ncbi:cytochrome P450 [Streptomyces malaysiensis]|uniref:cytochrome P450 n=1 Tax=Streptomyces malaysiensis TaxID=92644 RepID=UPI002B286653|nr:cytochrome P450 [Streptomyces malaysiensis]
MDRTDEIRDYPELRAAACPFSPPPGYQELRERSAVTRVRMWDGSTPFLVTGYHEARAVLGDSRFSADGTHKAMPRFTKFEVPAEVFNLGRMDDPEHARIRRMLTAHFTIRRTEAMRPMIQGIVDGLLDRLVAEGPPADLVADFAFPLPSQVIAVMLGVSDADFAEFQRASQGVMDFTVSTEEMGAALGVMVDYVSRMCAAKRAAPGDDLLSRLIVDQELTGGLTQQQVVATALVLLLAGHETTANMIALSGVLLLRHPEQLARLRADPGLMPNAVDELLRYITIVQEGTGRVAAPEPRRRARTVPGHSREFLRSHRLAEPLDCHTPQRWKGKVRGKSMRPMLGIRRCAAQWRPAECRNPYSGLRGV